MKIYDLNKSIGTGYNATKQFVAARKSLSGLNGKITGV